MTYKTFNLMLLGLGLMALGACSGQGSPGTNDVSVKVFSGLTANCDSVTALKLSGTEIGPGPLRTQSAINNCSAYTIDISGTAEGADSVLVSFNGQEISVSVNADGTYHTQIPSDVAPTSITVTPMIGEVIGAPIALDLSAVGDAEIRQRGPVISEPNR